MSIIIDRRLNPSGKNLVNRQRFIKRASESIRKSVRDSINSGGIRDIGDGEKVKVPARDILEPVFGNDSKTGKHHRINSGNPGFVEGDLVDKPKGGGGSGGPGSGQASDSDETSEDEYSFTLNRDEFLQFFFEDLELPDMVKKELKKTVVFEYSRSGYTDTGSPANLDIEKSYASSLSRRLALRRPTDKEIEEAEQAVATLKENNAEQKLILEAEEKLELLIKRRKRIPFFDDVDMKYRNFTKIAKPNTQAVMICLMDVSGSMTESKKTLAKKFFILLYLFLVKQYKNIDIVFIRHHTAAEETNEHDFFYKQETGGTKISSGLIKAIDIIKERYPSNSWNVYLAQATDGDNFDYDNALTREKLEELLKLVQYFAYIQVEQDNQYSMMSQVAKDNSLWNIYNEMSKTNEKLNCRFILDTKDIWPVFRELFEKKRK